MYTYKKSSYAAIKNLDKKSSYAAIKNLNKKSSYVVSNLESAEANYNG